MSSPFLWVLLPIAIGALLLLYRRPDDTPLFLALGASLVLAWVAWQVPIDVVMQLGSVSFEISPTLVLFGRNFTLGEAHRTLLSFIYLAQAFWLLGAFITRPGRLFAPLSLISVGLFVAALSVQPFLYAALMLAAVVLIQVPLLAPPGSSPGPGMQRMLLFQLFAVPFILFTGWLLTGVEASPGNLNLILRSGLLLALGFSFLMALFPFHSWLPMLARESHPYIFGFLMFFLSNISSLFLLSFIDRYVWLRENPAVYQLLLLAGTLGVLLAGLWAAAERNLGRLLAFACMAAIGGLLQAIGLGGAAGVQTFFALMLPQAWALWALAACLGLLASELESFDLEVAQASFRHHPLLVLTLVAGLFSIAGAPLLGTFPAHLSIWRGLGEQSVLLLVLSLLGSLGLLAAGIRLLLAGLAAARKPAAAPASRDVTGRPVEPRHDFANPYIWGFFIIWVVTLLGYGLLPAFLAPVSRLAAMFSQLFP
jgi:formate hydrogenlyase subunit 3/multisubunit Na+/H+ antiporter MnhD subunit